MTLSDLPDLDDQEVRELMAELSELPEVRAVQGDMCRQTAEAMATLGKLLWAVGYTFGPDRVEGNSPFGYWRDDTVGLAIVAQVGGQLGIGAADLFEAGNTYGAAALVRQLVEVEYLAAAFAEGDDVAAEWLRAEGRDRRRFWSPQAMRNRAGGRFLNADYWDHCARGGHPSPEASALLPEHSGLPVGILWADLAGHLWGTWESLVKAAQCRKENLPKGFDDGFEAVAQVHERWRAEDHVYNALGEIRRRLRASGRVRE